MLLPLQQVLLTEAALKQQEGHWENISDSWEGPGTDHKLNFTKAEIHSGCYLSMKDYLRLKSLSAKIIMGPITFQSQNCVARL